MQWQRSARGEATAAPAPVVVARSATGRRRPGSAHTLMGRVKRNRKTLKIRISSCVSQSWRSSEGRVSGGQSGSAQNLAVERPSALCHDA